MQGEGEKAMTRPMDENNSATATCAKDLRTILVVTRKGHMDEPVMEYALNVADRLGYGILAAYVNTLPKFRDGGERNRRFAAAASESAALFQERAKSRGILFESVEESGKAADAVFRLSHAAKRVEFVVIDKGIRREEVASKSPAPVFSVIYAKPEGKGASHRGQQRNIGEYVMTGKSRKRHVARTFIFGAMAIGLYAAVFSNSATIMSYFTKGGAYALLPVATVFLFSYIHGSFTSSFWSALGIENSKSVAQKAPRASGEAATAGRAKKDARPRAQVNA